MTLSEQDHQRQIEVMLVRNISELERLRHNLKCAKRAKAERDAHYTLQQAAILEDMEETRQKIERLFDTYPSLEQHRERARERAHASLARSVGGAVG